MLITFPKDLGKEETEYKSLAIMMSISNLTANLIYKVLEDVVQEQCGFLDQYSKNKNLLFDAGLYKAKDSEEHSSINVGYFRESRQPFPNHCCTIKGNYILDVIVAQ